MKVYSWHRCTMALTNIHSAWTCVALPGLAITLVCESLSCILGYFQLTASYVFFLIHEALKWFLGKNSKKAHIVVVI